MIAPGTICMIVGEPSCGDYRTQTTYPIPSRTCEILAVPGHCMDGDACDHVCTLRFSCGVIGCCSRWSALRPITPPPCDAQAERDKELVA